TQHDEPADTLDEGDHRRGVVLAQDQIPLPMTGHDPLGDLVGTLIDEHHLIDEAQKATTATWPAAGSAFLPAGRKAKPQILQSAFRVQVKRVVDRLVTDAHLLVVGIVQADTPADLL